MGEVITLYTAKGWAGNWLVLNSKEYLLDTSLNNECKNFLKTLIEKLKSRKGIPDKWLENVRFSKKLK